MELLIPSYPILFITFVIFLFMVLKLAKPLKRTNNGAPNLPPGPWKLPLIGNMHQLVGSLPHQGLANLAKRHGPLMHLRLGELSVMVVSSAEIAKEVMKTHDINFASRPYLLAAGIIVYGSKDLVFAPYGDYWRQLRKLCTLELLSAKRVESFRSSREKEVSNLINCISTQSGSLVNLSEKIFTSAIGLISMATIGRKFPDQEEFLSLADETSKLTGGFNVADVFPSIGILSSISGLKQKAEDVHKRFDRILNNIIHAHQAKRVARKNGIDCEDDEEDLVDILLKIQEDGDEEFPVTINNIKAVILDIFLGGSETSSAAVEWAMSELVKNPKVMKKAQAEVRRVFYEKGYVDEAGMNDLKYMKLVIKETLRLHPPLPLSIPRECRERCEINGYEIPVKTRVIVNVWAIGRNTKHWDDAESFIPERFQDSSIDYKGTDYELLPFGGGRRICPGINFGIANIELPLAHLLYHFDWKLPDGQKLEDLDMSEIFGASVRKETNLWVIPTPYVPSLTDQHKDQAEENKEA